MGYGLFTFGRQGKKRLFLVCEKKEWLNRGDGVKVVFAEKAGFPLTSRRKADKITEYIAKSKDEDSSPFPEPCRELLVGAKRRVGADEDHLVAARLNQLQ